MADPTFDLRSTGDVLRRSFVSFLAYFPSFLLASLVLLFFRSALLAGTLRLSAISGYNITTSTPSFSTYSVAGTLDAADHYFFPYSDDFFSNPTSYNSSSSSSSSSPKPFESGIPTSHSSPFFFSYLDLHESDRGEAPVDSFTQEVLEILHLVTVLSSSYVLATVGFILVYSTALGVVFFSVAASHLPKPTSAVDAFFSGAHLGIRRLTVSVCIWLVLRDNLIQSLSLFFRYQATDLIEFFLNTKLMAFSLSPAISWLLPHDAAFSWFFFVWVVLDAAVAVAFAVMLWVAVMKCDGRRLGRSSVKEGFYLVSLMPGQAILIKMLETVLCVGMGRVGTAIVGGRVLGGLIHSLLEVYFMVVWLVFYLAARRKEAELEGRRFGLADLVKCIS